MLLTNQRLERTAHLPFGEKRDGRLYGQHILSVNQFTRDDLEQIFRVAEEMRTMVERVGSFDLLKGSLEAGHELRAETGLSAVVNLRASVARRLRQLAAWVGGERRVPLW